MCGESGNCVKEVLVYAGIGGQLRMKGGRENRALPDQDGFAFKVEYHFDFIGD